MFRKLFGAMKRRRSDDKGVSIIAIVVLLVPITLMLTSTFTLLPILSRKARSDEDKALAVMTAESGLQFGMQRLNSTGILGISNGTIQTIPDGGEFYLTFAQNNPANLYEGGTLTCNAQYPATLDLPAGYPGRKAVLSIDVAAVQGAGSSIVNLLDYAHPIIAFGKNNAVNKTVEVTNSTVVGSVLLNDPSATATGVNGVHVNPQLGEPGAVPPQTPPTVTMAPPYEIHSSVSINANCAYTNLAIKNNGVLTVDVRNNDVTMVVDDLEISGGGKLIVNAGNLKNNDSKLKDLAPHRLIIYVNKTVKLEGYGGIGHEFHPEAMFMYYNGEADFYLKDGSPADTAFAHFLFFVTSTKPNLYLTANSFAGHFMTNSEGTVSMIDSFADCTKSNGWAVGQRWPLLIYAPKANVIVETTTIISGLVAETLEMDNHAEIRAANNGHPVNVSMLPDPLKNLITGHSTLSGKDVFSFNTWKYID